MTIQNQEARGSAGRILLDMESTFKTEVAYASRKPRLVPFNTHELSQTRPQNESGTMTGDRNPVAPFSGFKDASGAMTVPVTTDFLLYLLKSAVDASPASQEVPASSTNVLSAAGVTVSIASGVATFSAAQTGATEGDRVIYEDSDGTRYNMFLAAETSDTVWDVATYHQGATPPADITDATVIAIITNLATLTACDVTIAGGAGVATLSVAQTNSSIAAGCQVILDIAGTMKRYFISAVNSTTEIVLVDGEGFPPPNGGAFNLECIETKPTCRYTYKIHPTAKLPSFMMERLVQDVYPNVSYRYFGCKVNTFELSVGGDGELLATFNLMGAKRTIEYMPYDCEDIKTLNSGSNPTIQISSGTATIGTSQTSIAVGNAVVYRSTSWTEGDPVYYAEVATKASGTSVTLTDSDGNTPSDIGSGYEIIHLYDPDGGVIVGSLGERFEQFDFEAWEGSIGDSDSNINLLEAFSLNISNNLEGDKYVLGGQGERRGIPAARATVSGTITALFENAQVQEKAKGQTTSALRIKGTNSNHELDIKVAELKYEEKDVPIGTPGGLKAELNWKAFKTASNSEESAVTVVVRSELFM